MENKPAQNIQDTFLNTVRKDKTPITIYLVSGVKLTGKDPVLRQVFRASGKQQPGAVDLQARDFDGGEQPRRDAPRAPPHGGFDGHGPICGPMPSAPSA